MNGSVKLPEAPTRGLLSYVEGVLFRHRRLVLASLAVFTLIMGWFAVQLRMDAGFEKQLPVGHEYIETFEAYRNDLLGANRLTIVVKAREGDIWSAPGLKRLYDVTQAVTFLPGVSRSSVRSLWTPNAFVNEITEEGFRTAFSRSTTPAWSGAKARTPRSAFWRMWRVPWRNSRARRRR